MKEKITQEKYDIIFKRCYNSGKFQYSEDIIEWMNKKFEVVKRGTKT